MSADWEVGRCERDGDYAVLRDLLCEAFAVSPEQVTPREVIGPENFRAVRRGGEIVGGLALLPMGQFFGGRSVRMTGVAAVATRPESRGGGAARVLLERVLAEMHADGVPISTLYPATLALYRRAGYEVAGVESTLTIAPGAIDTRDRMLTARMATAEDTDAIRGVYAVDAPRMNGMLDRSATIWYRVGERRGQQTMPYVFEHDGRIEGYAYVMTEPIPDKLARVRVNDMALATPAAARRLLTFLADYRTIRSTITWRSSPADPLLPLLREAIYELGHVTPWMTRIVHVERALAARGYPPGRSAELHFEVIDEQIGGNVGRWVLRVADGVGLVERGGAGTLRLHVRGLAGLYTGYLAPRVLVDLGLAEGPAEALAAAEAVFAGPIPWMRDAF
jgi:predicted acetyltransferase